MKLRHDSQYKSDIKKEKLRGQKIRGQVFIIDTRAGRQVTGQALDFLQG